MTVAPHSKESIEPGLACSVRALVCYCRGGRHGSMQADMMQQPRVPQPDQQAVRYGAWFKHGPKAHPQ